MNRKYLLNSEYLLDDIKSKNLPQIEDDLIIEELIKNNDNNLEEILKDLSKDELFLSDKVSRKMSEQITPQHILDYVNQLEKEPYKQISVNE